MRRKRKRTPTVEPDERQIEFQRNHEVSLELTYWLERIRAANCEGRNLRDLLRRQQRDKLREAPGCLFQLGKNAEEAYRDMPNGYAQTYTARSLFAIIDELADKLRRGELTLGEW